MRGQIVPTMYTVQRGAIYLQEDPDLSTHTHFKNWHFEGSTKPACGHFGGLLDKVGPHGGLLRRQPAGEKLLFSYPLFRVEFVADVLFFISF